MDNSRTAPLHGYGQLRAVPSAIDPIGIPMRDLSLPALWPVRQVVSGLAAQTPEQNINAASRMRCARVSHFALLRRLSGFILMMSAMGSTVSDDATSLPAVVAQPFQLPAVWCDCEHLKRCNLELEAERLACLRLYNR